MFHLDRRSRFADPNGVFVETYAGSDLTSAAIEVFEQFRADSPTVDLVHKVKRVGPTRMPHPINVIPRSRVQALQVLRLSTPKGRFPDVMATLTQSWLSFFPSVQSLTRRYYSRSVVDSGVILAPGPRARSVTGAIAKTIFDDTAGYAGVRFSSRVGSGHENWAIFERAAPCVATEGPLVETDGELLAALQELGLELEPARP